MREKKPVTSSDVARLAGVSRSTVSLVLNRSSKLQPAKATAERVLKAAAELGYAPNSAGRMLVNGATDTIGLIVPSEETFRHDAFMPQFLHGVSTVAGQLGFHVLVETIDPERSANPYQRLIQARRIDGLIVLAPRADNKDLANVMSSDFPVVIGGDPLGPKDYAVTANLGDAIREIVQSLIDLGHKNFGYIPFSGGEFLAHSERLKALHEALADAGLTLTDSQIEAGNFSARSGRDAFEKLIQRHPETTALFCGNDTIALGAMNAIRAHGLQMPSDISVVGMDDLPFAKFLEPALTTVGLDAYRHGQEAAKLMIDLISGSEPAQRVKVLEATPIYRTSCAAPRA